MQFFIINPNRSTRYEYVLCCTVLLSLLCAGVSAGVNPQSQTVLGIYMIGGDLEYDPLFTAEENAAKKEGATKDISEMVSGWGAGSENPDIVVAYGGSQKKGWEGMTIATIQDLKEDLENGVLGDTEGFYKSREEINMGSPQALSHFLAHLKNTYPNHRVILILWGHGSGYFGFGGDTNNDQSLISLGDLQSCLEESGLEFDLIGLDACYMADIEVMRVFNHYAKYYIGSEETEPDHGWDYQALVSELVKNPDVSIPDLGKVIVDTYLSFSPDSQDITLSLIDLKKIPVVLSSFESFSKHLNELSHTDSGLETLTRVAGKLNGIGRGKDGEGHDVEYMIDMVTFTNLAEEEIPSLALFCQALRTDLDDLIVYTDKRTPSEQIHGIGIFSPRMTARIPELIHNETVFDLNIYWTELLSDFGSWIRSDTIAPEIKPVPDGFSVYESGYALITDVYYRIRSDNSSIILAQIPSKTDQSGTAKKPQWDHIVGSVLTSGSSSSPIPMYYVESTKEGIEHYYAWGVLVQGVTKELVRMDIWINTAINTATWSFNPYTISSTGEQEFKRSISTLIEGDMFIIYSQVLDSTDAVKWEEVGRITWGKNMQIVPEKLPAGTYASQIFAIDLAGNVGESEMMYQTF